MPTSRDRIRVLRLHLDDADQRLPRTIAVTDKFRVAQPFSQPNTARLIRRIHSVLRFNLVDQSDPVSHTTRPLTHSFQDDAVAERYCRHSAVRAANLRGRSLSEYFRFGLWPGNNHGRTYQAGAMAERYRTYVHTEVCWALHVNSVIDFVEILRSVHRISRAAPCATGASPWRAYLQNVRANRRRL